MSWLLAEIALADLVCLAALAVLGPDVVHGFALAGIAAAVLVPAELLRRFSPAIPWERIRFGDLRAAPARRSNDRSSGPAVDGPRGGGPTGVPDDPSGTTGGVWPASARSLLATTFSLVAVFVSFAGVIHNERQREIAIVSLVASDSPVTRGTALSLTARMMKPDFARDVAQTLARDRDENVRRQAIALLHTLGEPATGEPGLSTTVAPAVAAAGVTLALREPDVARMLDNADSAIVVGDPGKALAIYDAVFARLSVEARRTLETDPLFATAGAERKANSPSNAARALRLLVSRYQN